MIRLAAGGGPGCLVRVVLHNVAEGIAGETRVGSHLMFATRRGNSGTRAEPSLAIIRATRPKLVHRRSDIAAVIRRRARGKREGRGRQNDIPICVSGSSLCCATSRYRIPSVEAAGVAKSAE